MSTSIHFATVAQLAKMLENLDRWIEKAVAHAKAKGFDPDVLVQARLAPDQFPFARQVQSACDNAKNASARIAGKEAPRHEDTEKTIEELRARIRTCVAYLKTFEPKDLDGASERTITLPFMPGKAFRGDDYLVEFALPNFYFHVVTAYAILRHNGVDVGKVDYIGGLTVRDA